METNGRPVTRIFDVFFDLHLNERLIFLRHRAHYEVTLIVKSTGDRVDKHIW